MAAEGSAGWPPENHAPGVQEASAAAQATRAQAVDAWMHVGRALATSGEVADRKLAGAIAAFIKEMPISQAAAPQRVAPERASTPKPIDIGPQR